MLARMLSRANQFGAKTDSNPSSDGDDDPDDPDGKGSVCSGLYYKNGRNCLFNGFITLYYNCLFQLRIRLN